MSDLRHELVHVSQEVGAIGTALYRACQRMASLLDTDPGWTKEELRQSFLEIGDNAHDAGGRAGELAARLEEALATEGVDSSGTENPARD